MKNSRRKLPETFRLSPAMDKHFTTDRVNQLIQEAMDSGRKRR